MKASEFRIGNLVLCNNEVKEVYEFNHNLTLITFKEGRTGTYSPGLGNFKLNPIPLTKEWIEKLGGYYANQGCAYDYFFDINKDDRSTTLLLISEKWNRNAVIILREGDEELCTHLMVVNYVHELQNLYFALTGNELTIKP